MGRLDAEMDRMFQISFEIGGTAMVRYRSIFHGQPKSMESKNEADKPPQAHEQSSHESAATDSGRYPRNLKRFTAVLSRRWCTPNSKARAT